MNAVAGTARKFEDWADDTPSSWAPTTMFPSPFGEDISAPDPQFWTASGNSTEELYYRPNPLPARGELEHGIDASDSLDASFAVDNNTTPSPAAYMYTQHPSAHSMRHSNHYRHGSSGRHRYVEPAAANDETIFHDNDVSSPVIATTSPHQYSSQSSESMDFSPQSISAVSPASGTSVNWIADGISEQEPHASPSSINAAINSTAASGAASMAAPPKNRRNRERNRVAAHKCRQKAKQSMSDLQTRERQLSQQNRALQEHAVTLRDEILDLKNEILRHSSCDSDVIQNYIARAARDLN
ncbi:hypothetical protein F5Y04DRAFT_159389 [Hypomontagnella monticulosa]|nr:hypothetical protein F5Y04DRAFT_159389 [Hypomontagnella monticulosa]